MRHAVEGQREGFLEAAFSPVRLGQRREDPRVRIPPEQLAVAGNLVFAFHA